MTPATLERARGARVRVAALLAATAEVVGVGVTFLDDGFAVKVNLRELPASCAIPDEIDGVPVIVEVVGPIQAG
jgi:hypothetical protein